MNNEVKQNPEMDKNNPTNHSTIMTNRDHEEKALAYDVAIGLCHLAESDFSNLRKEADWRLPSGLVRNGKNEYFAEYIKKGKYKDMFLQKWVKIDPIASMPKKSTMNGIVDSSCGLGVCYEGHCCHLAAAIGVGDSRYAFGGDRVGCYDDIAEQCICRKFKCRRSDEENGAGSWIAGCFGFRVFYRVGDVECGGGDTAIERCV
ncbi:hypothetical protein [Burkholderia pyrrocinia]|uniref:hypothetical protein n=1 Tax=Burkholderia pyrrocinia TaxID=60550 RepID=UPI001FC7EA39|nr:hypothetical protein [Burkholderia pyrrocinia]